MRRIIMFNRMSADWYFTDASGSLGWIVPGPKFDRAAAQHIGAALFASRSASRLAGTGHHVDLQTSRSTYG